MKNDIALIVVYFGELPSYIEIVLYTLRFLKNVDIILFTDSEYDFDMPNMKIVKTSLKELKNRIQSKLGFEISLEQPYKICDYRPAFGYIFEKELMDYKYWGHCDFDMIFGDIYSFLQKPINERYSKIYQHGHLTLYKNDKKNNKMFMNDIGISYKKVFTTGVSCVFDEVEGIQKKYDLSNAITYKKRDCADISPWHYKFVRTTSNLSHNEIENFNYKKQVFFWEDGKVYRAFCDSGNIKCDEFNYIHFQKRNLRIKFNIKDNVRSFYITQNGFYKKVYKHLPSEEEIEMLNSDSFLGEIFMRLKYYHFIWTRRYKKYLKLFIERFT